MRPLCHVCHEYDLESEAQLQDRLCDLLRLKGYLVSHALDSRHSEPGLPDIIAVGRKGGPAEGSLIVVETKKGNAKLREATVTKRGRYLPGQQDWLDAFAAVRRTDAMVVRTTDDWDSVVAKLTKEVLR